MRLLNRKRHGFTLAEVLITLGVIGVVAALTIPTIMANIQGKRFASQFRKTISTLNNAVRMNQANHDFNFADAGAWLDGPSFFDQYKTLSPENSNSFWAIFNGNLKGNWFPGYTSCEETHLSEAECRYVPPITHSELIRYANSVTMDYFFTDSSSAEYILNDGSIVTFGGAIYPGECSMPAGMSLRDALLNCDVDGGPCLSSCGGYIDVNGASGPNREVQCKNGQTTSRDIDEPCEVDAASMGDVFPIVYFDSTVVPATNASKYVFEHYK